MWSRAAIGLGPKGERKSMLDPRPAVIRKETLWLTQSRDLLEKALFIGFARESTAESGSGIARESTVYWIG